MNQGFYGWSAGTRVQAPAVLAPAPPPVSGSYLWLDAQQVVAAAGASVATWSDLSGNARDATAAGTAQPLYTAAAINGRPGLSFNGTSSVLALGSSFNPGSNITWCMVVLPSSTSPIGLLDSSPNSTVPFRNNGAGSWEWWSASPSFSLSLPSASPQIIVLACSLAGLRQIIYQRNGQAITTATNASTTPMGWTSPLLGNINAGSGGWYNGYMGEVLCYASTLSGTQLALLATYFGNKWQIPLV